MSPERTQSYRRVMRTLDELGPSKLQQSEQDRIRTAADTLIFSSGISGDPVAEDSLLDIERLCGDLVDCGRWEAVAARQLSDDLYGCGPRADAEAALRAA